MKEKTVTTMMIFVVAAVLFCAAFAIADPTAPLSLTEGSGETRDLSGLADQTATAQGGNVTSLNIDALTITTSWQGYYGNITGEITLDNAAGDTFYNWSMTAVDGEVYATRVNSITWGNVNCSTAANVSSEETYLGQQAADGDSVSNTYTLTTHPAFTVGSAQIYADTCPSTNGFVNSGPQSANWKQVLLHDPTANIVYSTLTNDTQTGFDGSPMDFQLLVGENEKPGNIGSTTYYFWVELN